MMSKEDTIKKLRLILDNKNNSQKNITKDDERYILTLKDRLKPKNQEITYRKVTYRTTNEDKSLQPIVTIHPRKKQKIKISKIETKIEVTKTDLTYESEGLFEVEKTDDEPYFLKVKPKISKKKEKKEELIEWKVAEEKELETVEVKELEKEIPEWKIVEEKETEPKEEIPKWEALEERELEPTEIKEEVTEWEIIDENETKEKEEIAEWEPIEIDRKKIKSKEESGEWIEPEYVEIKPKKEMIYGEKPEPKKKKEKKGFFKKKKVHEEKKPEIKEEKKEELMWEPIESDEKEEIIKIFNDIESIDNDTSILLYKNGYKDVESLKKATIKDLKKIKGLKRKIAKQIIKDLEEDSEWEIIDEKPESSKKEKVKTKESKKKLANYLKINKKDKKVEDLKNKGESPKEISEEEFYMDEGETQSVKKTKKSSSKKENNKQAYNYKKYTLYEKKITTKRGDIRTIRFFSKGKPEKSKPIKLPKGYTVKENKNTGVPHLRKKK